MTARPDPDRVSVAASIHGPDARPTAAAFAAAQKRQEAIEQAPRLRNAIPPPARGLCRPIRTAICASSRRLSATASMTVPSPAADSVMTDLPRGLSNRSTGPPIATARWASPPEIVPHRYKTGDIWLGLLPVPHEATRPVIAQLQAFRDELSADQSLHADWRAKQIATIDWHLAALSETDVLPIGAGDDRHLVTLASTRAGKGTSLIIPNLCLYPGSSMVIDPKGENARITASRRGYGSKHCKGLGQSVCVLDPYDTTGLPEEVKAGWNPLDRLTLDDDLLIDRAAGFAEALIVRSNEENAHFDESARILVKALILYVALVYDGRPHRNLVTVHDLLTRGAVAQMRTDLADGPVADDTPPDAFAYLLELMQEEERCDGVIAAAATMIRGMGDRERGGVLSTARRNLEFLERRPMRRVLAASSFDIDQIKTDDRGVTVYLCLPPQRMDDCGRWLRLVVMSALERMYEIEEPPATGYPVLFLLEEFASLRHMPAIEHAAGYAAGFGVKLWIILQDLPQLKAHYSKGWETFLGNAGAIQAFANGDPTTLEFLSKKLGEAELAQSLKNVNTALTATTNDPGTYHRLQTLMQNRGQMSLIANPLSLLADPQSTGQSTTTTTAFNEQIQRTPLLRPDEIERLFRREAGTQIVQIKGARPFVLHRAAYFDSPDFKGLYEPPKTAPAAPQQDNAKPPKPTAPQDVIAAAARYLEETAGLIKQARGKRG